MFADKQQLETYNKLNKRALEHFFTAEDSVPVSRLDVSDKSLARILVGSLTFAVRQLFHETDLTKLEKAWRFQAQMGSEPGYFAFLLATCRIEWEREGGQFARDFTQALGVKANPWINMLPDLWNGLELFLNRSGSAYRSLVLPSHYASYNRIGHTVGLVFPRRTDRRRLTDMFVSLGELDPPIPAVCGALEGLRSQLSDDCRREADRFREYVGVKQDDARVVRFWQILRQALESSELYESTEASDSDVTLAFWSDEDGIFEPWLLLRDGAEVPSRFTVVNESNGIDGWRRVVTHDTDERCLGLPIFNEEDDDSFSLLSSRTSGFIRDGVIPLADAGADGEIDWMVPADGFSDSVKAYLFHKKSNFAEQLRAKGTRTELVPGSDWYSCFGGADLHAKENTERLVRRVPRLAVQGVKFRRNQFVNLPGFRPTFTCDLATKFEFIPEQGQEVSPQPSADVGDLLGETTVRAISDDGDVVTKTTVLLINQLPVILTSEWSRFSQSYWLPAPTVALAGRSANEPHPQFLPQYGEDFGELPDTTMWQSDEIWLGPRVGDVSTQRQPGFDWRLVETDDGNRRLLCFEGTNSASSLPDLSAVSTNKGACRLWRRAFDPNKTQCQNSDWQEIFTAYSQLRVAQNHRRLHGKEFGRFEGNSPPPRKQIRFDTDEVPVNAGVEILETVLRARASGKRSPLSWQTLWNDYFNAFNFKCDLSSDRKFALSVLRAWHEIGIFDLASTAWGGLSCVVRRPYFVLRQVEDFVVATLVGLTDARIRRSIRNASEDDGWQCAIKFSSCGYVPPVLEIRKTIEPDSTEIIELSTRFGLSPPQNLCWSNVRELPPSILPLGKSHQFFATEKEMLPVSQPLWTRPIDRSELTVTKYNPQYQPPVWAIGPTANRWAVCTSADWAWRLAWLAVEGKLPFSYSDGMFSRDNHKGVIPVEAIYLPLEVGRLLTIISSRLPGPVDGSGYVYYAPSQMSGTLLADRLAIAKE